MSAWAPVWAVHCHSWLGCGGLCVFVCALRLYPATLGRGVGVCVCLCARSACTLALLAGCAVWVWLLGLGFWTAPCHSWLGCRGVSVLVCALCVYPATPGWGSWCGCVCWGFGFGCAPPLLAGVSSCVCFGVRAPLLRRHSWLGCAVWVCVLGGSFGCAPPLLLGRWGLCVFVCALRLYPATPGWGVRCGCVCLVSDFGCTPRLLALVLGCVCLCVRAPLVPRHSWLGSAVCVCVLGLGLRLCPATPGWGVGVTVCLCARSACAPILLTGVFVVGVCAWARVWAAPRHPWLGHWGLCVFVCTLRFYLATPGWVVRCWCVCWGFGLGCAPPLLAAVLGCVCVGVRAPLVPRHSWLGCAVWVCVLGLWFRLRPAIPRLGVGVCVCLCARSACTPPLPLGCVLWVCVLGLGFRLRPASPGWGVGVCVSLCVRFACTPPLLAGVCGVCVCAGAWVSAAPRHSWLGCWGVCVMVCKLPLYPATPGWSVLCGCVCLGAVSAAPRHCWLGCWGLCVFVSVLRLYPATPGWGAWCGCVRLGSGFGCAPPLLAGLFESVCVCVRPPGGVRCGCVCLVSGFGCAPPLLSGFWGVCVFVCALRLYPTTPGWGVQCVCVCLGAGSGCALPLLAGVLASLCVCVRAPLVRRYSCLGCAVWVCLLGLRFPLRPANPGWGVGVCVCLCARSACTPPLLAGVRGVGVFAWAWVSAAPRHSWLGCWGVCVFACALRLYPTTPGWGVRCGCVCSGLGFGCALQLLAWALGCVCVFVCALRLYPATTGWGARCLLVCLRSGFGCAPPLLTGVSGSVCVCVRAPLVPRHSWLGCVVWVCVFGLGFRLRPATPGWGVRVCVCLCAPSACTPPLLAEVCGVGVCAWSRVLTAPCQSCLGCWGVCVFVCALRLYPTTPSWGVRCVCVCLGVGSGCAPPLLAGPLASLCVCVRAPLVRRYSCLGCAVWVCLLGFGFRLRPANPGWGVGVCLCLCARSACTPPLLAGVPGVGVFAWAWVSAAPHHSWLGCWGVCVFVCALRLYPATPGLGVRCGCLCCGSGFGCAPPLVALALGCVCVFVCALRLYPATTGWGARCPFLCLGSGFGCALQLLAGVLACVGVCLRASLVPRQSWLGCAVWVFLLAPGFLVRPATPGWVVGVSVCLCARSACTLPLLAWMCGVGMCAWAWVSAAPATLGFGWWSVSVCVRAPPVPRLSSLRCAVWVCVLGLGFWLRPPLLARLLRCLCVLVRARPVPRLSWLGCAVWVCVLGLGFRRRPATPGWGAGVCACLCSRSACTPLLLAGARRVGLCAWARVSAAPCHSWLGCWGVCVFMCALSLYPATPGWAVRCGCVCLGSGFGWPATPGSGVGVCVFVCAVLLYPASPGWGVWCGCVCFGLGFGCAPLLLAVTKSHCHVFLGGLDPGQAPLKTLFVDAKTYLVIFSLF